MGKLTLKELAERLGVSVSAVSLAINGRPGLSDETRSRILTEVEAAGYQVKKALRPPPGSSSCFAEPPRVPCSAAHREPIIFSWICSAAFWIWPRGKTA